MAASIDPHESARRVRAAIAWSGVGQEEIAKRTGIKPGTMRGYTSPSRPTSLDLDRRHRIADACGVPRSFMEFGFDIAALSESDGYKAGFAAALNALEERLQQLETQAGLPDSQTEEMTQLTRRTKQALAGPSDDDAQATEAGPDTRDAADATPAAPRAPGAGRRRSAGQRGR